MALPRFLNVVPMDTKMRKVVAAAAGLAVLTMLLGIWFGYLAAKNSEKPTCYLTTALKNKCARKPWSKSQKEVSNYFRRSLERFQEEVCLKAGSCYSDRLPRTCNYIAYHLNGKTITIDGRNLDPDCPFHFGCQTNKGRYCMKPCHMHAGSLERFQEEVCLPKAGSCHSDRLPRNYIAYHLNGKTITIDGRDSDPAWAEVLWSETFIDMRGKQYPKPRLDTKFKIRWDDSNMYVFIYIQETDLYGTHAINDTNVWKDNGIEMLMDVDGSMWYYKQVQVNVLGAIYDLMLAHSPYDAGGWQDKVWFRSWSSNVQHAIYKSGTINDPSDRDKFWSVELALDWTALAKNSSRITPQPKDNEVWFMQFGRSEWKLNVTNNTYVKANTKGEWMAEDWWSWQSCRTINLHLQDRWGLVQFKKNPRDRRFLSTQWHLYKALFDVHDGMTSYKALNKRFTDSIYDLTIPTSLLSQVCVEIPTITLTMRNGTQDFNVTIKSRLIDSPPAHIRSDRYVWFE